MKVAHSPNGPDSVPKALSRPGRFLAAAAVALSVAAAAVPARTSALPLPLNPPGSSSGGYGQVGTITGPGIPPAGLWQFDISWYDPGSQTYLLSDGTSNALDLFDGVHDVYMGQVTGFAGPTGVVTTDANTAWVGDGDSTVKVVDLSARKIVDAISTGGTNEADEIAYDLRDGIIAVTNPQDIPTFVTLISTETRKVLGRVTIANSLPIIEQPLWDPIRRVFLIPVQRSAATPVGGLISIDPLTMKIVRTTALPDACAPFGMALGPRREMLVNCPIETLIINVDTGALVTKVYGLIAGDQAYYDNADGVYAVAAEPVLGIVDARTHRLIASPTTGVYSHSVAVSPSGQIFVPIENTGIGVFAKT